MFFLTNNYSQCRNTTNALFNKDQNMFNQYCFYKATTGTIHIQTRQDSGQLPAARERTIRHSRLFHNTQKMEEHGQERSQRHVRRHRFRTFSYHSRHQNLTQSRLEKEKSKTQIPKMFSKATGRIQPIITHNTTRTH